jgi:hypothetical protein
MSAQFLIPSSQRKVTKLSRKNHNFITGGMVTTENRPAADQRLEITTEDIANGENEVFQNAA